MKRRSFFTRLAAVFTGAKVATSTDLYAARKLAKSGPIEVLDTRAFFSAPKGPFSGVSDEQERKWAESIVIEARQRHPFRELLEKKALPEGIGSV